MKKKHLEKELRKLGWYLENHGGKHDIWTNGKEKQPVPRHPEIKEFTAKGILKVAKQHPGGEKC